MSPQNTQEAEPLHASEPPPQKKRAGGFSLRRPFMVRRDSQRATPPARRARRNQRTAARAARAEGDVMRLTWRLVSSDAALMCPALFRVDLREGLPEAELSSTGPPRLSERLVKLCGAVPTPSSSVVSMLSSRDGLRTFLGRGGRLALSTSAMYASAFVAIQSLFLSGAMGAPIENVTRQNVVSALPRGLIIHTDTPSALIIPFSGASSVSSSVSSSGGARPGRLVQAASGKRYRAASPADSPRSVATRTLKLPSSPRRSVYEEVSSPSTRSSRSR